MHPKMNLFFFILLLLLISSTATILPPRFLKPKPSQNQTPQQYLEVSQPLETSTLTPSCTLPLFHHTFRNTYSQPPATTLYSPPPCTWSNVTLIFSASSRGNQYDRIAAVWLAGAELLRTSTAEPTEDGVFWEVKKDVTRYSALLVQQDITLSVMLENIVDRVFTGVYEVNVSFVYYSDAEKSVDQGGKSPDEGVKSLDDVSGFRVDNVLAMSVGDDDDQLIEALSGVSGFYGQPADLIIPISNPRGGEDGFWFRIESELDRKGKRVMIPRNTYRAVVEVYVSFHGNDEFWYKNPPNSYIISNNLDTGRGNGAYREVFVTIDGKFVGTFVPFPVIFTGGINPLFWEPVVGIGAFDLPTYDFDLTPFLSFLLDGKMHSIGLGVADGISFWLVDANLHLWLDPFSEEVQSGYLENRVPSFEIERAAEFDGLDGEFEVEIERWMEFSGWVNSSFGNFTTYVKHELEFESNFKIKRDGTEEVIKQKVTDKIQVKFKSSSGRSISESKLDREYPLEIRTSKVKGANGTYTMTTSLDNSYEEKTSSTKLENRQIASGWMLVEGNEVLDGESSLNQEYSYNSSSICYSRVVAAANGTLLSDTTSLLCLSSY